MRLSHISDHFKIDEINAIKEQLLNSKYMGKSTLTGAFEGSLGFSITFTTEQMVELYRRFPYLKPFVSKALNAGSYNPLRTSTERLSDFILRRPINTFFLNLLVLAPGQGIANHVDATLVAPAEENNPPRVVSVLYLQVPLKQQGEQQQKKTVMQRDKGELLLYEGRDLAAIITPKQGCLLHFRGGLAHEVCPIAPENLWNKATGETKTSTSQISAKENWRISLVCEQYHFPESVRRQRFSKLIVKSKGCFAHYLKDAAKRPINPLLYQRLDD